MRRKPTNTPVPAELAFQRTPPPQITHKRIAWKSANLNILIAEPAQSSTLFNAVREALPCSTLLVANADTNDCADQTKCTRSKSERNDSAAASSNRFPFDIAFVDTSFLLNRGVEYARTLQELDPVANVVLVGNTPEELAEGFPLHCSGYVVAPLTCDGVYHELSHVRYPLRSERDAAQGASQAAHVYVRCFGAFEVFCDGVPLRTKRQKSKELLACLVCQRGALFTVGDVEAVLWELSPYTSSNQSYLRHLVADLQKSLQACGAQDVLVKQRGLLGVNTNAFECDYYDYLDKKPDAPPFAGQFMSQYSWAEPLGAALAASGQDDANTRRKKR